MQLVDAFIERDPLKRRVTHTERPNEHPSEAMTENCYGLLPLSNSIPDALHQ